MRRILIPIFTAAIIAACASEPHAPGVISDEEFVEAMLELRMAARSAGPDEAAFLEARDRILAERSLTEDDLREYVAAYGADPERLAQAWRAINETIPEPTVD